MSVTIKVNGSSNSLVHKGSNGFARNTVPDVCKTPSPGGPIPVPYPVIMSLSSNLKNGTRRVKADGGKMIAVKGSEFSRCTGDEPGTVGGVKSNTNMKEAKWILYSFDVKIESKNACRQTDKMTMNHGNTFCLGGQNQISISVFKLKTELKKIAKACNKKVNNDPRYKKKSCRVRGIHKHKCCQIAIDKKGWKNVKAEYRTTKFRLDVAVISGNRVTRIFDFKFNCPPKKPKMSPAQRRAYRKAFKCQVDIVHP